MSIPQIQTELIILDNFPDPTNYTSWEVYANDVHTFLTKMGVFTEKEIEFKAELNNIIKALNIDINTINENSVLMEQLKIEILQKVEEAKTSAENAKNSEIAAKTSEQNAKQSEQNTKTSETNAKQSEELAKQYAQSSDARNALLKQNNLSDLENKEVARENLELSYAMQEEVNTGVVEDKVLSPKTLSDSLCQTKGQDSKRAMSQKAVTDSISDVSLKAGDIILTANESYTYPAWAECNGNNVDFGVYPAIEDKLYKWSAEWEQLPDLNPPLVKALNNPIITGDGVYIIGWQSPPFSLVIYKNIGNVYTLLSNISIEAVPYLIKSSVNGDYIVATLQNAPWLSIFKRVGDTFTRLEIPVVLSSRPNDIDITKDAMYLALTIGTGLKMFKRVEDTFIELKNAIPGYKRGGKFSPDASFFATVNTNNTGAISGITMYKKAGDVFTQINLNIPISVVDTDAFSFSPNNNFFIAFDYTNLVCFGYKIVNDKFIRSDIKVNINVRGPVVFTKDEQYFYSFGFNKTYITKYKKEGDSFILVEDLPNRVAYRLVSTDADYIADAINISPFIKVYKPGAVTLPDLRLSIDVPNNFKYKIKTGL